MNDPTVRKRKKKKYIEKTLEKKTRWVYDDDDLVYLHSLFIRLRVFTQVYEKKCVTTYIIHTVGTNVQREDEKENITERIYING